MTGYCEPPEEFEREVTLDHTGIMRKTDKAILFRKTANTGFWLPKSIITQQTNNTVTYYACVVVQDVNISDDMCELQMREYRSKMAELIDGSDREDDHLRADEILCDALRLLGETELPELWDRVKKWYS